MSLNKTGMESTTATPTVKVEIYNQTYNIRSDGDTEYIIQLAEFVDSRMREHRSLCYYPVWRREIICGARYRVTMIEPTP